MPVCAVRFALLCIPFAGVWCLAFALAVRARLERLTRSSGSAAQCEAREARLNLSLEHFGTRSLCACAEPKKSPREDCSLPGAGISKWRLLMQRIIGLEVFEGKLSNHVRARAVATANGHVEISVTRPIEWRCVELLPRPLDEYVPTSEELARDEQERRERSFKKASQRAKRASRLACKTIGADTLLTLTYQRVQRDLALCKRHLKEFFRRVCRVWPGFRAVCGFELQQRGAWHVHIATSRVPQQLQRDGVKVKSYGLLTAIWRDVVGEYKGTVNTKKRKHNQRTSCARIAAYLSKYITKNFAEGEKWSNRWTSYGKIDQPIKLDLGEWPDMRSAIEMAYSFLHASQRVVVSSFNALNDVFFFVAEPVKGSS